MPKCGNIRLIEYTNTVAMPKKQFKCFKHLLETCAYNLKICKKVNDFNRRLNANQKK